MVAVSTPAMQWFGVGAVLAATGALVKFRGWTFLVAGYDEASPVPDDVVADVAGSTVLRLGLAALALGVVVAVADAPPHLSTAYSVAAVAGVARVLYRLHSYAEASVADAA